MEAMPAKYKTDNQEHIVIRPLAFCKEKEIEKYAVAKAYPIIPCNLCGSQQNMQRQVIKNACELGKRIYRQNRSYF